MRHHGFIEQRALYDGGKPSAFDLTATTGNLIIQLPLSNWTDSSSAITAKARRIGSTALLREYTPLSVSRGHEKQRSVMIKKSTQKLIFDAPLIDYGAITDSTDLDILYSVYMKNRELMAAPDLAVLRPIETAPAPGITDEEMIKEQIKKALTPSNAHQCCTAAMMKREDGGVVDAQNRVYGTQKLSVVDASVWPLVVGGGPQTSVYGSAEKAADTINKRHSLL